MISGISGRVRRFGVQRVYIDAGGLEYEVHVTLGVYDTLQRTRPETEVYLYIHHQFSQEEQKLFGFLDPAQREFFQALQNIKGLGTVLTLSLLSHLDGRALLALCDRKDVTGLSRIPRIGKATAERLVFEIGRRRDKFQQLLDSARARAGEDDGHDADPPPPADEEDLAFEALLQLGYKEAQARKVLAKVAESGDDLSSGEMIRAALQLL